MSMKLLRLFGGRNTSAPVARERLQILLAHERGLLGQPDLLVTLREEILAVVSKHVTLDPEKVIVRLERGKTVSTLEVDIEVPNDFEQTRRRRNAVWRAEGGSGDSAVARKAVGGVACRFSYRMRHPRPRPRPVARNLP